MSLNYDDIAEILKIIDNSSLDELIVEAGDLKLVIRRNSAGAAYSPSHDIAAPATSAATAAQPPSPSPVSEASRQPTAKAGHQIEVTAPMVGTFYRAPSPDAAPFVEIGKTVRKGDPLCVIEVMKLFTTIASEHAGRVVQIGAENAELVEYGRTLFVLEPT